MLYPAEYITYSNYLTEGILQVPKGVPVETLPLSHFEKLAKKIGPKKVIRALTNLQNWFKYKKPSLSKWAVSMKDSLRKRLKL